MNYKKKAYKQTTKKQPAVIFVILHTFSINGFFSVYNITAKQEKVYRLWWRLTLNFDNMPKNMQYENSKARKKNCTS